MFYFLVVFDTVEQYAPGFKQSIVGTDILTPPDLEQVFNLTGGVSFIFALRVTIFINLFYRFPKILKYLYC